jgi:hypothetical protein
MKVTVKHRQTELCVEDNTTNDTNYNLVYYNQEYVLKLIKEMIEHINKLNNEHNNI